MGDFFKGHGLYGLVLDFTVYQHRFPDRPAGIAEAQMLGNRVLFPVGEAVVSLVQCVVYALEQYTNWDDKDIPESVIEAFVVKIVASKDGFDWYLRFNGNPDDPLHCTVGGKRKSTATISVAGECSPAVHKGDTGCN